MKTIERVRALGFLAHTMVVRLNAVRSGLATGTMTLDEAEQISDGINEELRLHSVVLESILDEDQVH